MGLTFLVGPARSGKSTIAKQWVNYEIDINNNQIINRTQPHGGFDNYKNFYEKPRVLFCGDTLRLVFGHRYNSSIEHMIAGMKDIFLQQLLMDGHDVLVDGTHTTKLSIEKLFTIDKSAHYYVVNTPIEECKKRAVATNQPDLISIIERHHYNLDYLKYIGNGDIVEGIESIREKVKNKEIEKIV